MTNLPCSKGLATLPERLLNYIRSLHRIGLGLFGKKTVVVYVLGDVGLGDV